MNHQAEHTIYQDALDLSGVYIRRTNLSGVNLSGANLTGADCSFVDFRGANFKDAILTKTILRGADLSKAINLTAEQIAVAILDKSTILPDAFSS